MTDRKSALDADRYATFQIEDARETEWNDVRLSFSKWNWLRDQHGSDEINGYYLNGYGVEGLVKAVLLSNGLDPNDPDIHYNSEGDTCYIHFKSLDQAVRAAELSARVMQNRQQLEQAIAVARERGFDDN